MKQGLFSITLALGALLVASCVTKPKLLPAPRALTAQEKQAFAARAKDPRIFGLTPYGSERGPVFDGAFRPRLNSVGRFDFATRDSDAPLVTLNDEGPLLLIDTSAAESWLAVEAASQLGAQPLGSPELFERRASHVPDAAGGFAIRLSAFMLENARMDNGIFYVRNLRGALRGLDRGETMVPVGGVLGADALRNFEFVRISLRGRKVVFSGSSIYPYRENALATVPLIEVGGGLGVRCVIEGEEVEAMLDVAGDFEVALGGSAGDVIRQVSIGDLVFRQVGVTPAAEAGLSADTPPRLGRGLLERYDLVINRRGGELLLEKPTL
jgi:hypothetical protein